MSVSVPGKGQMLVALADRQHRQHRDRQVLGQQLERAGENPLVDAGVGRDRQMGPVLLDRADRQQRDHAGGLERAELRRSSCPARSGAAFAAMGQLPFDARGARSSAFGAGCLSPPGRFAGGRSSVAEAAPSPAREAAACCAASRPPPSTRRSPTTATPPRCRRARAGSMFPASSASDRTAPSRTAFADQAEACFANLLAILAAAGMSAADLVRLNTYLTDPADLARLHGGPRPARCNSTACLDVIGRAGARPAPIQD